MQTKLEKQQPDPFLQVVDTQEIGIRNQSKYHLLLLSFHFFLASPPQDRARHYKRACFLLTQHQTHLLPLVLHRLMEQIFRMARFNTDRLKPADIIISRTAFRTIWTIFTAFPLTAFPNALNAEHKRGRSGISGSQFVRSDI